MGALLQDLRYGIRMLGKSKGVTLAAVLSLALGLGANMAVFSVLRDLMLEPLPGVANSGQLMEVYATDPGRGNLSLSYPEYVDHRDRNEAFAGLIASLFYTMNLTEGDRTERVWSVFASGNYFDVLGVRAALGRTFLPEEDREPGQHPVMVISHGLWQRRFRGRPDVVGQQVALNNHSFTIIGVTPPEFQGTLGGFSLEAWVPLAMQDLIVGGPMSTDRTSRSLGTFVLGRLKPGFTAAQALERANAIARQLSREYPETNANLSMVFYPVWKSPRGPQTFLGPLFLILLALTTALLLIACANVANLLLSRAETRRREIGIRLSLGASRGRLMRQLLAESQALALLAGVAGIVVGYWTNRGLIFVFPAVDVPLYFPMYLNAKLLVFGFVLTLVTGAIFGMAPALQASRTDLLSALKSEAGSSASGARRGWFSDGLVVMQIALSLVLLVAAGLFLRSLGFAETFDSGFNRRNVLISSLDLHASGYDGPRAARFFQNLTDRLEALPGVKAVSFTRRIPLGFGVSPKASVTVEGYTPAPGESVWSYNMMVTPGYFRTLEIPLLSGREFTHQDTESAPRVAVVNQTFANQYWPGRDPLGRRVQFEGQWYTVVGVARPFQMWQLGEPPSPCLFVSAAQFYWTRMNIMVRVVRNPAGLAPAVRNTLRGLDPNVVLNSVSTLEKHVASSNIQQRLAGSLLGVFGVLALVLAAVGIFGVMAYRVAQRVREIGIRMALGAQREDILRLVMGRGALLTLTGMAIGLAVAWAATRLLSPFLLGVGPHDAATFGGVAGLLTLAALAACYIPSRRATKVDPIVALRHE